MVEHLRIFSFVFSGPSSIYFPPYTQTINCNEKRQYELDDGPLYFFTTIYELYYVD